MTFLRLLILGLSTFRLTILLTKDRGPGWVIQKFRYVVKKKTPKRAHLDEGVECVFCASIWFGAVIAISEYFLTGNSYYELSIFALALSGIAIIFNQQFTKD